MKDFVITVVSLAAIPEEEEDVDDDAAAALEAAVAPALDAAAEAADGPGNTVIVGAAKLLN